MPRYLFIAEKPSLCKAIKEAYDTIKKKTYEAEFFALHGHFMELQEPEEYKNEWGKPWRKEVLPMIPEPFKYKVKNSCESDHYKLSKLIKDNDFDAIVNACDAGREGEAIYWTLINSIPKAKKTSSLRLWAQDTTVETIAKALQNLINYDDSADLRNMRDASINRIEFDWLVGMNLSRASMLTTYSKASVGRVKSPTLNIVVQRDLEIANFVPKDYFEVHSTFDKYKGIWFDPKTKEDSFDKKEKAEKIIASCGKNGVIESVENEKVIQYAPAPYSLTELQKEANKAFGFTASQTLDLAQSLYETHKILSYPRTESRALSTALAKEIPDLLKALSDVPEVADQVQKILADPNRIKAVCSNKKYVDNKKVTDHHAIINTKLKPNLSKLSEKEYKLFILVVKKFVSIFLDPCITNKTVIVTDVDGNKFKTSGSMIESIGYKELYKNDKTEDSEDLIPKVKKGDNVSVKKMQVVAKQTKPPVPYTDDTLLSAMQHAGRFVDDDKMKEILDDAKGLGTPATRASIIEELIKKEFLYRKGKTIRATEFGINTIKILHGKNVISPILTAEWEQKLQNIESGNMTTKAFEKDMIQYIQDETKAFLTSLHSMNQQKNAIGSCPACGKQVFMSKNYLMCEAYKKPEKGNCTFISGIEIAGTKIPETEFKKILAGKDSKKMKFKSKAGKTFEAYLCLDQDEKRIKFKFDN